MTGHWEIMGFLNISKLLLEFFLKGFPDDYLRKIERFFRP